MFEDIAIELAIIERQALAAVRKRIASQQLGEAWIDLEQSETEQPQN